ncbi:MAG: hypothetical protein ACREIA_18015 [Opitutaceae bacterium]
MKQVLQNLGLGETLLADVPAPSVPRGHVLIRTEVSLLSPGTERMLVSFGQANLLEKARQQPEKVERVAQLFVICYQLLVIGEVFDCWLLVSGE